MIAQASLTVRSAYALFVEQDRIARSTVRRHEYELRRWERAVGETVVREIGAKTIDRFRAFCKQAGIGPETVEGTLNTVFHVLRLCLEAGAIAFLPPRGRREYGQPRKTAAISLGDFCRFVSEIRSTRGWTRERQVGMWATLYFSALRIGDVRPLEAHQFGSGGLPVRAQKTGKLVTLAVHPVLARIVDPLLAQWPRPFEIGWKTLYRHLAATRARAGTPGVTPQAVRKLAARQFERAHPGAGRLVLGHSLPGASGYYLAEEEILAMASEKLAIPECFLLPGEQDAAQWRERQMVTAFRSLRGNDQEMALRMVEGMRATVSSDGPRAA